MQILLSNSQAGTGRTFKQEQEEISRNHVQAFILGSVHCTYAGSLFTVLRSECIVSAQTIQRIAGGGGMRRQDQKGKTNYYTTSREDAQLPMKG